jgi:VCBS repeat-containing protein
LTKHKSTCTGTFNGSYGEFRIKNILTELQVNFKYNKSNHELTTYTRGKRLRFDFLVEKDDNTSIVIEFNGKQHYEPVIFGSQTQHDASIQYEKQKKHDALKDSFCKEKGYPLIWIKYNQLDDVEILFKTAVK